MLFAAGWQLSPLDRIPIPHFRTLRKGLVSVLSLINSYYHCIRLYCCRRVLQQHLAAHPGSEGEVGRRDGARGVQLRAGARAAAAAAHGRARRPARLLPAAVVAAGHRRGRGGAAAALQGPGQHLEVSTTFRGSFHIIQRSWRALELQTNLGEF